jgi:hypothetical protein
MQRATPRAEGASRATCAPRMDRRGRIAQIGTIAAQAFKSMRTSVPEDPFAGPQLKSHRRGWRVDGRNHSRGLGQGLLLSRVIVTENVEIFHGTVQQDKPASIL